MGSVDLRVLRLRHGGGARCDRRRQPRRRILHGKESGHSVRIGASINPHDPGGGKIRSRIGLLRHFIIAAHVPREAARRRMGYEIHGHIPRRGRDEDRGDSRGRQRFKNGEDAIDPGDPLELASGHMSDHPPAYLVRVQTRSTLDHLPGDLGNRCARALPRHLLVPVTSGIPGDDQFGLMPVGLGINQRAVHIPQHRGQSTKAIGHVHPSAGFSVMPPQISPKHGARHPAVSANPRRRNHASR